MGEIIVYKKGRTNKKSINLGGREGARAIPMMKEQFGEVQTN